MLRRQLTSNNEFVMLKSYFNNLESFDRTESKINEDKTLTKT